MSVGWYLIRYPRIGWLHYAKYKYYHWLDSCVNSYLRISWNAMWRDSTIPTWMCWNRGIINWDHYLRDLISSWKGCMHLIRHSMRISLSRSQCPYLNSIRHLYSPPITHLIPINSSIRMIYYNYWKHCLDSTLIIVWIYSLDVSILRIKWRE